MTSCHKECHKDFLRPKKKNENVWWNNQIIEKWEARCLPEQLCVTFIKKIMKARENLGEINLRRVA